MKSLLFANTDWYLYNFRLSLARALREKGWDVVLISPPGDYSHFLQEAGFRWICFDFSRRGMNPLSEVRTIVRLLKIYRQEKPDVFHHFTIKCVLYGSIACGLMGKSSHVINAVTGLGYVFTGRSIFHRLLQKVILLLYRLALNPTHIIFQNPQDQTYFLEQALVSPERVSLIPGSGVDLQVFSPQPEPPGAPVVTFVGRLLRDKGVAEFVEAARMVRLDGMKARFILVGDCDPDNPSSITKAALDAWVHEGVVEWWGWQSDMLKVYAQSNLICLPSYREGMPRVLAEAAGCARALVASDVPGCREIVEDGVNGLLVPPHNSLALAGALRRLIEDGALRQEMGRKSRMKAESGFSVQTIVEKTLAVYQQVVE